MKKRLKPEVEALLKRFLDILTKTNNWRKEK